MDCPRADLKILGGIDMQKKRESRKRTKEDLEIEVAIYNNLISKKPFTPRETELFSKAMDRDIRSAMKDIAKLRKE